MYLPCKYAYFTLNQWRSAHVNRISPANTLKNKIKVLYSRLSALHHLPPPATLSQALLAASFKLTLAACEHMRN
jgi:hypothetical protein